ncbi:cytosol aminopeptidase family, catalytic domain protein, partial [Chlamydia psittaci 84-8471/1]
QEPLQY